MLFCHPAAASCLASAAAAAAAAGDCGAAAGAASAAAGLDIAAATAAAATSSSSGMFKHCPRISVLSSAKVAPQLCDFNMVYRCSIGSCSMCVPCLCMPATSCSFCLEFKHVNSVMQAPLPPQRRLLPRLLKMPATSPSLPLRLQHQAAVQVVFRMQHHVPSASIILVQILSNF
jgi:hypothetical protein